VFTSLLFSDNQSKCQVVGTYFCYNHCTRTPRTGSSHLTGKLFLHSHDATAADKDSQEDLQQEQQQEEEYRNRLWPRPTPKPLLWARPSRAKLMTMTLGAVPLEWAKRGCRHPYTHWLFRGLGCRPAPPEFCYFFSVLSAFALTHDRAFHLLCGTLALDKRTVDHDTKEVGSDAW